LQKVLFGLGVVMTPVISVQSSRVALMAPLLDDILTSGKISPRSPSANALASAAFNGCILLSTIFLTGKSSNSILYAMLSEQTSGQSSWFQWLLAASFPGVLLTSLFFIMQRAFFNHHDVLKINKFRLRKERVSLGKLSFEEWAAMGSILTLLVGLFLSSSVHRSSMWACLSVFFVLLATGALSKQEFRTQINWTFLFYLGAIIGIMRYIQTIGVDLWLAQHLTWMVGFADGNAALFLSSVYLVSWLCGLVLGTMTAPALLFTVLLPIAQQASVSGWLVAFVILVATEAWVFPYQSTYYLCFENLLKKKQNFLLKPLLQLNTWLVLFKLGIILASIPFWRWLGIL
jgi:DASS family divalent anion:Na+ symporter